MLCTMCNNYVNIFKLIMLFFNKNIHCLISCLSEKTLGKKYNIILKQYGLQITSYRKNLNNILNNIATNDRI